MVGYWEFSKMVGKNPSHTGGFINGYDSREFTQEQVVAREGGQNTSDAGKNAPGITRLEFHKLSFSGAGKRSLLEIFGFDEALRPRIEPMSKRAEEKIIGDSISEFLKVDSISAMLIRDFNTVGLTGKWDSYEPGHHFARLLSSTNLDDKSDEGDYGGSFGLGKTVYAKSSAIRTVIYHSVFEPTEHTEGANRRLMVTGVYPRHKLPDEAREFSGFAYMGERYVDQDGEQAKPLTNEMAQAFWEKIEECADGDLNLKRSSKDYGTDVLILMDDLSLPEIKLAIEDYYFPAILSGRLAVHFYDENGDVSSPAPKDREDLDQFIKLWELAKSDKDINESELVVGSFRKYQGISMGRYAFQVAEEDEAKTPKKNSVALMHSMSDTGMVVNYVKLGSDRFETAVGVYIADADLKKYLQMSENAAHSEWSHESYRLKKRFQEEGVKVVKSLNSRLKERFTQFQQKLQPEVERTLTQSGLLARLLSKFLSGSTGDRAPPPPEAPKPFAAHLTRSERSGSKSTWHFKIEENEHTPHEKLKLNVKVGIFIAGDSKMVAVKKKPFFVRNEHGKLLDHDDLSFDFIRGDEINLVIQYEDPGSYNYKVQCDVSILEGLTNAS